MARTVNTRVTREAILSDLADIRARGYALDDEESELGLKCVGVPLRDEHGRFSYAISISGPTPRMGTPAWQPPTSPSGGPTAAC